MLAITMEKRLALPAPPRFSTREEWLVALVRAVEPWFALVGRPLPPVRVALAWTSAGKSRRVIGECWTANVSRDGTHEIYVSPILDNPWRVADVLVHELCHAAAGIEEGHAKKTFGRLARAFGLEGKLTATTGGEAFKRIMRDIMASIGALPHAALVPGGTLRCPGGMGGGMSSRLKPQRGRMIKVECSECGYIARTTRTWLDRSGAPLCPTHNVAMEEESRP